MLVDDDGRAAWETVLNGDDDEREETGDAACWLDLVCPDCGAMLAGNGRHRPGCAIAAAEAEIQPPRDRSHG